MNFKKVVLRIEPGMENVRVDKLLATLPDIRTRSRAARLVDQGYVKLEQEPVKSSRITQAGESYDIEIPTESPPTLTPWSFHLDVVFEDEDVIVINKPAGLVVHPAAGHSEDTLVNALLHHTKNLSMGFSEQRPGIVHRLDKETSGLLVIAKNDEAHEGLAQQFRQREIHRIYWAVVYGSFKETQATIQSQLARHPRDRKKYASTHSGHGKHAVTHYRVLKTSSHGLSWLQVKLETGRTHQIRIHLSEASHPIVGDLVYGTSHRHSGLKSTALKTYIQAMQRIALHATELGFVHPRTGQTHSFSTPWPKDLEELVHLAGFI